MTSEAKGPTAPQAHAVRERMKRSEAMSDAVMWRKTSDAMADVAM